MHSIVVLQYVAYMGSCFKALSVYSNKAQIKFSGYVRGKIGLKHGTFGVAIKFRIPITRTTALSSSSSSSFIRKASLHRKTYAKALVKFQA
jgi:hypothetical protein